VFKVLLIGDAGEDIYHYGSCERLSPEAPVPILRHSHTEVRDGMCLNVRNNLLAFGVCVQVLHNERMIRKERFIDLRTKRHLLRADFGESAVLDPCPKEVVDDVDFTKLDAIVISDYDKGYITDEITKAVTSNARWYNLPVFVDSKKTDLSAFEGCIIKINKIEHGNARIFPRKCELIVTTGKNGAIWKDEVFPTEPCDVFDVCGAGDTFLAALVSEYLVGGSIGDAIRFSNKCARLVVQKFGTYTLQEEDIDELRD